MLALPSLKEGWGLVIGEAAQHEVPTLAYASAGGTTESVVDSVTGLLAADRADFEFQLGQLIKDESYRERLGQSPWQGHGEAHRVGPPHEASMQAASEYWKAFDD